MNQQSEHTIYKNILAAFLILLIHVLLVGGIGIVILFFYGIVNHLFWVILGISCISGGGVWLYKRLKSDVKAIRNITGESLKGRTIEASFLGGVANFKISDSRSAGDMRQIIPGRTRQISGPDSDSVDRLADLARLYEKELISRDEYERAKKKLLGNNRD
jgi:hypothetical protein